MKALRELTLSGCVAMGPTVPGLGALRHLEQLNMSGCVGLVALPGLASLTKLNILQLQGCEKIWTLPSLTGLFALQMVDLSACWCLTTSPELPPWTILKTNPPAGVRRPAHLASSSSPSIPHSSPRRPPHGRSFLTKLDSPVCSQAQPLSTPPNLHSPLMYSRPLTAPLVTSSAFKHRHQTSHIGSSALYWLP
uniref:Uncharacterized protein n=1 Tax=Haptolina brevifila TaxID=156173 RepID=A0A7S2IRL5_9EUKA